MVNLNAAPAAALEALPGIGPRWPRASSSIARRMAASLKSSKSGICPGIGPKLFDGMRAYLTVGP